MQGLNEGRSGVASPARSPFLVDTDATLYLVDTDATLYLLDTDATLYLVDTDAPGRWAGGTTRGSADRLRSPLLREACAHCTLREGVVRV